MVLLKLIGLSTKVGPARTRPFRGTVAAEVSLVGKSASQTNGRRDLQWVLRPLGWGFMKAYLILHGQATCSRSALVCNRRGVKLLGCGTEPW
jgi:hypothetical protein